MTDLNIRLFNKKSMFKWIIGVSFVPPTFFYLYGLVSGEIDQPIKNHLLSFGSSVAYSFLISASLFYYNALVYDRTFKKWPHPDQQRKRLGVAILLSLIGSNIIALLLMFIFTDWTVTRSGIFSSITTVSVITIIVGLLFVGYNFVELWKRSVIEKETLEKENIRSRLESLQHQVSPHFLFNSFNALQSLVDTNPEKAKQFIRELSRVYRYSLENRDENLVKLKEELTFIRHYIFLQKVRFDENLNIDISIPDEYLNKLLPPLSLQLLVENAIKHNIISSSNPLKISISVRDQFLVVQNNLQLRTDKLESTGIGLENLKKRYQLIAEVQPVFKITDSVYDAQLPLIQVDEPEDNSIDY